jgi:hypothetical protein
VHTTDAPVDRSVTVTDVPNARSGLAQVPVGAPYHEASPVVEWEGGAGAGGLGGTVGAVVGGAVVGGGTVGFGRVDGGLGAVVVGVVGAVPGGPGSLGDGVGADTDEEAAGTGGDVEAVEAGDGFEVAGRRCAMLNTFGALVDEVSVVPTDAGGFAVVGVDDARSANLAGNDHDVEEEVVGGAFDRRARTAPRMDRDADDVARDGVASRRSGTITNATQLP